MCPAFFVIVKACAPHFGSFPCIEFSRAHPMIQGTCITFFCSHPIQGTVCNAFFLFTSFVSCNWAWHARIWITTGQGTCSRMCTYYNRTRTNSRMRCNPHKIGTCAIFFEVMQRQRACVINLHMWWAESGITCVPSSSKAWRRAMLSKSEPVFRALVDVESISSISLSSLPFLESVSSMALSSLPLLEPAPTRLSLLMKVSCIFLRSVCNFWIDSGLRFLIASHVAGIDCVLGILPSGNFSASIANSWTSLMAIFISPSWKGFCRRSSFVHGLSLFSSGANWLSNMCGRK